LLRYVERQAGTGFVIHLTKKAASLTLFAYLVLN
jgi:hypothetical protein